MALSQQESSSCSFTGFSDLCSGSVRQDGKNLYKSDKKCIICENKFVSFYKKKYWCKFCRRAVCANCSPQRVPNPETMRIDRICNVCYQRVMADHFKKEIEEEISGLRKQRDELNFLLGQEIRNRAKISTKKRILENILSELEKESERKERDLRTKISKLKGKKENSLMKMDNLLKKFNESQREKERKERKIKELEEESHEVRNKFKGNLELWAQMRELREKKLKLIKKCELTFNRNKSTEGDGYDNLMQIHKEISEENQQLLEELSSLSAELEIKEQKIKNLQKKITEIATISNTETEFDAETKEIKAKILHQQECIEILKAQLSKEEDRRDAMDQKPCKLCEVF